MFNLTFDPKQIQLETSNASLQSLKDGRFENQIKTRYQIQHIGYSKANSEHEITSAYPNPQNAGPTFSYVRDSRHPCVRFKFSIIGNYQNMEKAFDQNFLNENYLFLKRDATQIYLELLIFNDSSIEGDDEALERINAEAISTRKKIEARIELFNQEVETINDEVAKLCKELILAETTRKQRIDDANQKLNPF